MPERPTRRWCSKNSMCRPASAPAGRWPPGCRWSATCAAPPRTRAAMSRPGGRRPRWSSKPTTARRCRAIAAWSRTASSPTGGRTGLTVYISTQFTAGVREELARAFGLPLSRVRVIVDAMGGGFGSKSTLGYYGRAAVALSRQAGAPVRLVFDRQEEQVDSGYRPATWQRLRIGARRDGTLTAISLLSLRHGGHGARCRRRQRRLAHVHVPQLRRVALRRVYQRRGGLRHARPRRRAGGLRAGTGDRRTRRKTRHGPDRAARPHRPEPGAARGTPHRRRAHRLEPPPRARRRDRPDQDAASAWDNRCGARTCRSTQPARCA